MTSYRIHMQYFVVFKCHHEKCHNEIIMQKRFLYSHSFHFLNEIQRKMIEIPPTNT